MNKNKKHWFKPKRYGYGFYPVSWQGWLATLALLGVIVLSAYVNGFFNPVGFESKDAARFVLDLIIIIFVTIVFFDKYTDGEAGWRWGDKD